MESDTNKIAVTKTSSANKRMGLTLLSIAVVFFASVIIKKMIVG
ncbi:cytochrome oxidase small assembly protein [Polynucleobacter kasalickyi]|uniref:Uncharacterized protein n=1 Tax=Polynucleobacter kasalickyi TaxID=1938817 RepID=A0A1W2ARA8_9BURK|nr:hypothetical protein SAMN06296008_11038 [Polynucleobacter kasalickyi]